MISDKNTFEESYDNLKKSIRKLWRESKKIKNIEHKYEYLNVIKEINKDVSSFGKLIEINKNNP
jgi:hypothetical protein